MAKFLGTLTTDEAQRLTASQIELLRDLENIATGLLPSEAERQASYKDIIQKAVEKYDDRDYQAAVEASFAK